MRAATRAYRSRMAGQRVLGQHLERPLPFDRPVRQFARRAGQELRPGHAVGQGEGHHRRAVDHEPQPGLLAGRDVLEHPAQAERAHGGALPRLGVGQVAHRGGQRGAGRRRAPGAGRSARRRAWWAARSGRSRSSVPSGRRSVPVHARRRSGQFLSATRGRMRSMPTTSARLLALLSLLQARRDWPGAVLGRTARGERADRAPRRRPAARAGLPDRRRQGSGRRLPAGRRGGAAAAALRRRAGRGAHRGVADRGDHRDRHRGVGRAGADHGPAGHAGAAAPPRRRPAGGRGGEVRRRGPAPGRAGPCW